MKLRTLAAQISQEYDQMSYEFRSYQVRTGLACRSGCGQCCTNPQIEASPLEMLPMALDLFDRGKGLEVLEMLSDHPPSTCIMYKATSPDGSQGFCSGYEQRASICRMFGAAGFAAKNGGLKLSVCRLIKSDQPQQVALAEADIERPPNMAFWSQRIRVLNGDLGERFYPINQALRIMLEKILLLASYEDDGGGHDPKPILPRAS